MNNQVNNLLELEQKPISPKEKELFDFFLSEYKKDYNPISACLRMGVNRAVVYKCANDMMRNPYILRALSEDKILALPEDKESVDKAFKFVINTLYNIANNGSNKDKLEACKQISAMYGLNKPIDINTQSSITNVIEIPQSVSDEEWERQATCVTENNMRED